MPSAWPSEQLDRAAPALGAACLELLSDPARWVHRRVETVDLLRREAVHRRVTVEVSVPEPLQDDLRVPGGWAVPLGTLRKQPLRHFDLAEDDEPLGMLTRRENGRVAGELLLAAVRLALPDGGALTPEAERLVRAAATAEPDTAEDVALELDAAAEQDPVLAAGLSDTRVRYFRDVFAGSYLLLAVLRRHPGRHVVKFAYEDAVHAGAARGARAEALGWAPVLIDVEVPGLREAPSYHAEVVVPPELRVTALIYDQADGELLSGVDRAVDRASLHVPDTVFATVPVLSLAISAERSGALSQAVSVAGVTSVLLLVGGLAGDLETTTAGTSATVLLAGSAVFAGTVARAGEHRLVRQVLLGPRVLLSVVALLALAAAATVGFGARDDVREVVWTGAGLVALAVTAALAVAYARAAPQGLASDPVE